MTGSTLLNLPGGARELSQSETIFLKSLPNETRRLLIWAIDRTMDGHVDSAAIDNRLAQELADTSSRMLKQALWVIDSQTQGYAALQMVQEGPSLDGGLMDGIPDTITALLSKVKLPVKNLLMDRDSYDYEARLNSSIVAGRANTSFLGVDRLELQAWRNVMADMTLGADSPNPAPTTVANGSGVLTQAAASITFKASKLNTASQKSARESIVQAATELAYPVNRLLAQCFQESAYKPEALNPSKAAGVAQFMPATGKAYGLLNYTADFFDPYKAALAAVQYMRWLERWSVKQGCSQDPEKWYLALAAYNWGIGNVQKAIRKQNLTGKQNLKWDDIAALSPTETQNYVIRIRSMESNPA
jgi:hypothetical protein